jgi:hypothetical protein
VSTIYYPFSEHYLENQFHDLVRGLAHALSKCDLFDYLWSLSLEMNQQAMEMEPGRRQQHLESLGIRLESG